MPPLLTLTALPHTSLRRSSSHCSTKHAPEFVFFLLKWPFSSSSSYAHEFTGFQCASIYKQKQTSAVDDALLVLHYWRWSGASRRTPFDFERGAVLIGVRHRDRPERQDPYGTRLPRRRTAWRAWLISRTPSELYDTPFISRVKVRTSVTSHYPHPESYFSPLYRKQVLRTTSEPDRTSPGSWNHHRPSFCLTFCSFFLWCPGSVNVGMTSPIVAPHAWTIIGQNQNKGGRISSLKGRMTFPPCRRSYLDLIVLPDGHGPYVVFLAELFGQRWRHYLPADVWRGVEVPLAVLTPGRGHKRIDLHDGCEEGKDGRSIHNPGGQHHRLITH